MPLLIKNKSLIGLTLLCGLLLVCATGKAQSLGDPVVHITFGSGSAVRGPALAADSGSTTYTYYPSGQVGENGYTITNLCNTTTHGSFITSTDHTGNSGGYMMVVNGNVEAGTVFTRKVPGLCGNTSYQFGVWIENVLQTGGILPNMVFHIYASDGVTELGSGISTGDVTNRTWKFYSANFTLPAGTDGVVIKLISNASGTQGNDFAIDDLTFSPYDAQSISVVYDDNSSSTTQATCAGSGQQYTIKATSTLTGNHVQKLQAYVNGAWVDQGAAGTQTSFTVTAPATAGTYYYRLVTAIADNIGSASCVTASNQLTLTVNGGPTAAIGVDANTCLGGTTAFTDKSTSSGTTISKWVWDFGDGTTSKLQNPTHTYTVAKDYTVTLTVYGSISTCTSTTQTKVHVSAVPKAIFTASAADCSTRTVTFTDNSTAGEGTITVRNWDFGDGKTEIHTDNSPVTHQYAAVGNYPVTLKVTIGTGCENTSAAKTVSVYPLPQIKITLPDVCTNDAAATFTNTSTIADGSAITYLWNFGDGGTSTDKNPSHKYAAAANYHLILKATSAYGCTVTKDTTFTVNGDNPKAIFAVKNSTTLCSSEGVVFDITGSGPSFGNITKVVWYFDYANNPTVATIYTKDQLSANKLYYHKYDYFNTPATKAYKVRMIVYTGGDACSSAPYDMTITIKANPKVSVSTIGTLCQEAGAVQIVEDKKGFSGTGVFTGTGVSSTGLFNPAVSGAGIFPVTYIFTSANGCQDTVKQDVTVYSTPTVSAGADFTMLEGASYTLKATADGTKPLKYKWTLADGSPATALSSDVILQPVATPKDAVSYMLTVTSANGCTASAIVKVNVLKAPVVPNTFTPNNDGTNDTWYIKYLDTYPDVTVDVFNRYGFRIFSSIGYPKPWDGTYNGQQLPVGTYYYIINPKLGRSVISGSLTIIR